MSVFNARLGRRDFSCWLYFSDKSSRWRFNNPRFASFTVKLPTFNDTLLVRLFLAFLTVANLTIWEPNAVAEINFIPCLFHSVTEIPWPGCRMTRACTSFHEVISRRCGFSTLFLTALVGIAVAVSFCCPLKLRPWWSNLPQYLRSGIVASGIVIAFRALELQAKR